MLIYCVYLYHLLPLQCEFFVTIRDAEIVLNKQVKITNFTNNAVQIIRYALIFQFLCQSE